VNSDEHFLHHIVGRIPIGEQVIGHRVDRSMMAAEEFVEGSTAA
jgi:hypothetical protein